MPLDDSLAGDAEAPLSDESLLRRFEASKGTVEIFVLIDSELEDAKKAIGEKPKDYAYESDTLFWYEVLSRAATLEGQKLTAAQWARVHETIGSQLSTIIREYGLLAQRPVDPRFFR